MSYGIDITKSRLRRALFGLFFSNPDQEYYVRELERLLGFSAANIRRDLIGLTDAGIFISRKQGNLVYYGLNKDHHLYEELKSIVFKTIGIEGSLRDIITADKGVELAYIYGSFADGRENSGSDIDIMIIGRPEEDRLMKRIGELEDKLSREINYTVYSYDDYLKKKETKDSFVVNLETRPRIILVERVAND